jgi:peptidyl-prolyl cis-trans isomerase C
MPSTRQASRRFSHRLGLICAASALLGCQQHASATKPNKVEPAKTAEQQYGLTPQQAAQVLVQVGDTRITLGEFAERLGSQSPYLRARYHSPERRREFLENMVRFELLAKEAERLGYTRGEEVERVRKQVMVQQMMQDLFDKGGLKLSDVSDAEIEHYYTQNLSEFDKPAQVRASHILYKERAPADKALALLKQKPNDMDLFRSIAQTDNTDPATKHGYGDLRFFSETPDPSGETDAAERPLAVRKAAFSLDKVGDIYPSVVESPLGFHIVKLTAKREALKRSLADARRMIQNKLWRAKREEAIDKFVADLRAKANVQEDAAALAKVQVKDALGRIGTVRPTGSSSLADSNWPANSQDQAPPSAADPTRPTNPLGAQSSSPVELRPSNAAGAAKVNHALSE